MQTSTTFEQDGSSARAEIDPRSSARRPQTGRLLRPRGDRPQTSNPDRLHVLAPPPARRSTLQNELQMKFGEGSSARAEIDPCAPWRQDVSERLLRPRGDRPYARRCLLRGRLAPPPARRSTLFFHRRDTLVAGSSARAEIDPYRKAGH